MKKRVLILIPWYLPGFKAGGPIQSVKNMIDHLNDKIDFFIITSDRDLGDKKPYDGVNTDQWTIEENAHVYYTNAKELSWRKLRKIINGVNHDLLYLNGFFPYKFSILSVLLHKMGLIMQKPIILAPRGEFFPGALGLKRVKKWIFIRAVKVLRMYDNIIWHATNELEAEYIKRVFGSRHRIKVASNLAEKPDNDVAFHKATTKNKGELKIIFISRIHPKKNLKKAIELLREIDGMVEFNIYGYLQDRNYWHECERVISSLPKNVKVEYRGLVEHKNVINRFRENHVFLFPTMGENFGHVILEALIGACPVIISDQTPWRDLEQIGVGWDIPLDNEHKFIEIIQKCINMDEKEYMEISMKAYKYGKEVSSSTKDVNDSLKLFIEV